MSNDIFTRGPILSIEAPSKLQKLIGKKTWAGPIQAINLIVQKSGASALVGRFSDRWIYMIDTRHEARATDSLRDKRLFTATRNRSDLTEQGVAAHGEAARRTRRVHILAEKGCAPAVRARGPRKQLPRTPKGRIKSVLKQNNTQLDITLQLSRPVLWPFRADARPSGALARPGSYREKVQRPNRDMCKFQPSPSRSSGQWDTFFSTHLNRKELYPS